MPSFVPLSLPDPARRLLAALATGAALLLAAGPALAATPREPANAPVGGELMGHHGVVVYPTPGVPPVPTGLSARSWLVADIGTGEVLAARDPHAKYLPASTLKTLTAVTLIPRLDPDRLVTASAADVDVDGSKVGLVAGTRYKVSTLFTAMLVVSGNDAANTLASAAGGTPHTLDLMNEEAHRLQADDTHAGTPSGLDAPGETTSAYDLALIARAGLALPDFRAYVGTVQSTVNAPHYTHFQIYTHNRLLTHYKGAIGVKNGYTVAAQATFVGAATRGGHTLVVTLMHADPSVWREAAQLLDWGFAADGAVRPVGRLVDPLPDEPARASAPHLALAPGHPAAAVRPDEGHDLTLPMSLAGGSVVGVGWLALRNRRLRRRRPGLPPL